MLIEKHKNELLTKFYVCYEETIIDTIHYFIML